VLRGCPVIVAQNTTVSDTYRGIGDSIGRYSGILIPGIGGIDRKTDQNYAYSLYRFDQSITINYTFQSYFQ